jgi:hypothetical protein
MRRSRREEIAMRIHGLSQSTGVERMLGVDHADGGVLLTICDSGGGAELAGVVIPSAELLSAIVDRQEGGSRIEGMSPAGRGALWLDLEIRRNEVWLRTHAESEQGPDVAVGLDDFQEALEGAVADGGDRSGR